MNVFICGGTGFIGYHCSQEFLERNYNVSTISIPDIELGDWYPKEVNVSYGNIFTMPYEELVKVFEGQDAMVYAIGPDDRVKVKGDPYEFFYDRLVEGAGRVVSAARDAGVKKCVVLNSYFAYFDRIWPNLKLAENHPYIKARVEQADRVIKEGGATMDVMVLELPYIFGTMPERVPLWKDILVSRLYKMKNVLYFKGGSNMISVEKVAEAIVGAVENGRGSVKYPVGDENLSWVQMIKIMLKGLGLRKKILIMPTVFGTWFGMYMKQKDKKEGLKSGLDTSRLFKDIMCKYMYFDASDSATELGYSRGGVEESILKTMEACKTPI